MTLWVTTAALVILASLAMSLWAYVAFRTQAAANEIRRKLDHQIAELAGEYRARGMPGLVAAIRTRSRESESMLYLVATADGQELAGNVESLEPGALDHLGFREIEYRLMGSDRANLRAFAGVVQLPGGFHLLVGHELANQADALHVVTTTEGMILLTVAVGLLGFLLSRRLRRGATHLRLTGPPDVSRG